VSDVPVGGGTVLQSEALVLTQPARGRINAFSATCTHNGCTVSGVQGSDIVCPCHGSRFSVQDGSVSRGPAQSPLGRRTVNVAGDDIYLV
jgi:Rieske Fe-S protein